MEAGIIPVNPRERDLDEFLFRQRQPAMTFRTYFSKLTDGKPPHAWQEQLAEQATPTSRLIRVPTGLGKTLGALLAWAYHRLGRGDERWPRRLVWCLPMRTLVDQTVREAQAVLDRAELREPVEVHQLMGGVQTKKWWLEPEKPAVLVGTQDMLLSRALNRGFASARGRWPVEYGLLHTDALWVMDEVQLMGVGLATSEQLQVFRDQPIESQGTGLPGGIGLPGATTWWMSATLRPEWWASVDWNPSAIEALRNDRLTVPEQQWHGPAWEATKPVTVEQIAANDADAMAQRVLRAHREAEPGEAFGGGRVTLAIHNTVVRATATFDELHKLLKNENGPELAPELRLIHSRFRGAERDQWSQDFLSKDHCTTGKLPGADRIIIATQVVEAGVDISATALLTELAPWPSLVQRLGRAARYGGSADIIVIDRGLTGKDALPYDEAELDAAREAIQELDDAGLASLERFERSLEADDPERLQRLYPYQPLHRLTRRENDELFDTTPDLTGADLDISRFVRDGEERDVQVFWDDPPPPEDKHGRPQSPPERQPGREELCRVPIGNNWWNRLVSAERVQAWAWDYLDREWQPLRNKSDLRDRLVPGKIVWVDRQAGGYDRQRGFTGDRRHVPDLLPLTDTPSQESQRLELADAAQDGEEQSQTDAWQTVLTHSQHVTQEITRLAQALALPKPQRDILTLAARLHDWGKTHPAFAACFKSPPPTDPPAQWAKAPKDQWVAVKQMYRLSDGRRRGFRHELASTLALFELLSRAQPDHPALLRPHRPLMDQLGWDIPDPDPPPTEAKTLAQELSALSAADFNLLAYLVCAHHGKVRGGLQATPHDQDFPADNDQRGQPLRGVREGDTLPATRLPAPGTGTAPGTADGNAPCSSPGSSLNVPAVTLHLDPAYLGLSPRYGSSWAERVAGLLAHLGPFTLAYLEALMQAADKRASENHKATPDPLLDPEGSAAALGKETMDAPANASAQGKEMSADPKERRVDTEETGARVEYTRANGKKTYAHKKKTRANVKEMREKEKKTRANEKETCSNGQERRANGMKTRTNGKERRANAAETLVSPGEPHDATHGGDER
jgi:CRISPR-associated endonuclease/helicase Cas3